MESVNINANNSTQVANYFISKGISFTEVDIKDTKKCLEKLLEVCDDANLKNQLRIIGKTPLNLVLSRLRVKPSGNEKHESEQPKRISKQKQQITFAEDVPEEPETTNVEISHDEPVDNIPDEKPKRGRKPASKDASKEPSKRKPKQSSEEIPREEPPKWSPIEQSKDNMTFNRPSLEIPTVEYEKEHAFEYLQALIDTYDFDKGKKQMGTVKKEDIPERTNEVIDKEKKEAADVVGNLKALYDALISDINDFRSEYKDDQLKITDNGIKIIRKVPKEVTEEEKQATDSKGKPKKPPMETIEIPFTNDDVLKDYNENAKMAFKYISKEFIAEHYKTVLMSGILNSRSVVSSGQFKLALDDIERIGMLKNININITSNVPNIKLQNGNFIDDYYELLMNAKKFSNIGAIMKAEKAAKNDKTINLHDFICGHGYEVFSKRQGIIKHIGYPHINVVEAWNKALSNMSSPETDVEKMWLEVLKSPFMFDIIMYGTPMNQFIEAAFKVLVNQYESSKLYFTKLFPISFMFTSLHMFCEGEKIETCLSNSFGLYKYESFTWCAKELTNVKCVIDVINEQLKKPEKVVEEKAEELIQAE